jgi:hypothetical protein
MAKIATFISKSIEIEIEIKNQIVDNAIHRIKEIEKGREHLEKKYLESKQYIEEIVKEFEPLIKEYENFDVELERQKKIVDLYTKGKSRSDFKILKNSPVSIQRKVKKNKQPTIRWIDIFVDIINKEGIPLSFNTILDKMIRDVNFNFTLMNKRYSLLSLKSMIRNSIDGHCDKEGNRKKGTQQLFYTTTTGKLEYATPQLINKKKDSNG